MPGKYEGNRDEALAERLHIRSMDGSWSTYGDVQLGGHYSLVEDEPNKWYIIREDNFGFVDVVEGPKAPRQAKRIFDAMHMDYYTEWEEETGAEESIEEYENLGAVVNPDGSPSRVTLEIMGVERREKQRIRDYDDGVIWDDDH